MTNIPEDIQTHNDMEPRQDYLFTNPEYGFICQKDEYETITIKKVLKGVLNEQELHYFEFFIDNSVIRKITPGEYPEYYL